MKVNRNLRMLTIMLLVAITAALALAPTLTTQAAQNNSNPDVIPSQSLPYGHTYGEWSNMWWQWAFSIPAHKEDGTLLNPLLDSTGVNCGVGQSGPVWFLGGAVGTLESTSSLVYTRTCAIPAGKALYFPVLNFFNDNISQIPSPAHYTLDELRQQLEGIITSLNGCPNCSVEVDGHHIQGMFGDADRIGPGNPSYSLNIPEDNLFDSIGFPAPAQTVDPQISDGWYVMLAPLSAGPHTLRIRTSIPDVLDWDFTYHLTVGTVGMPVTGSNDYPVEAILAMLALILITAGLTLRAAYVRRISAR